MMVNQPTAANRRNVRKWVLSRPATAALIVVGSLFAWWSVHRADRELRSELLRESQLVAQAMDVECIRALSGAESDLASPEYQRLKAHFVAARSADPHCRFLYLTGRRSDGTVFFFVDSEPTSSENYSPPGQTYEEASSDYRRVFDTKVAGIEGPASDRWGSWVSALIPIHDTATASSGLIAQKDAQAMVRKAADFYRKNGRECLLKEANDPQGKFRKGNLYVFAYDLGMVMRAHPVKPELVGQQLLDKKDWSGGKYFRREIQEVAISQGSGWVDYQYEHPVNKKIMPKTTYVEKVDDLILCAGAYKGTGELLAVLGMDVDARDWKWAVAGRAALPVALMFVLLIGLSVTMAVTRHVGASPKPVLRRLLPPLTAMLILLISGTGALLWMQQQQRLTDGVASNIDGVGHELRDKLNSQATGLAMGLQPIVANPVTQRALREGDADSLLTNWWSVYETLHRENNLTHFYFLDKNRVCLLRIHKPEKRGDRIERFTAREAERTGKTASGIELGPLGTLTLRVVQPVYADNALVGYVELGKEIEEVIQSLRSRFNNQLAVVIHKENLNRQEWEAGMRMLGREPDWDRLSRSIVAYASQRHLPDTLASWADQAANDPMHRKTYDNVVDEDKEWQVSATPLQDASGKEVADLLIMHDISHEKAAFARLLLLALTIGGVLILILLGVVYVLLHRTDVGIRAQQTELQESEERHRVLFEQSRDAMMTITAPSWRFAAGNPAALELFGVTTTDEFLALGPWDVSPEWQPDGSLSAVKAQEMIATALREGGHFFEWMHRRLDGEAIPCTVLLTKTYAAGQVFLQATVRDISAIKQAEAALRESEKRFRRFAAASAYGFAMGELSGRLIFANEAMLRIAEEEHEEAFLGSSFFEYYTPENAERLRSEILPILFEKGQWVGEIPLLTAKGNVVSTEQNIFLLRDEMGNPWRVGNILTDITDRKRAEEVIQESERKYRSIFDSFLDLYFQIDMEGTVLNVSPSVLSHTGWSSEEVIGMSVLSLYANPEDRQSYYKRLVQDGKVTDYEVTLKRKDGSLVAVSICSRLVFDGQGNPIGVDGTMRDISERKQAEKSLQEYAEALTVTNNALKNLNKAAESATRAKSEFLANMSHEIRTPMTAILGFAELLLREPGIDRAPPERIEAIRTIQRNGEHLLGLINDILDLSKVEAGKMQIEPIRCSPMQLVTEVVSLMRVRAEAKRLKLRADLTSLLPETVLTDPLRLRQVLVNLVGNAIKFTNQGEVGIALRLTKDGGSSLLRIDVTDTGIGMSEEQIGQLFKPFTQVDNSASRKFGGTGLGLSISKRLTEAMGGNIEVRSAPGKGSTFSVTIDPGPLYGVRMIENTQEVPFENGAPTPSVASDKSKLHSRVLLAEDGPDNQVLLCAILGDAGAEVTTVDNGQLAVEAALAAGKAGQPFDVILMDMQMPVMDGYEATRQLRQRGHTGPIVALTAHAMAEDRQKCLDAGCSDYATKPIDCQKLLAMVAQWSVGASTESGAHGKGGKDSATVEAGNRDGVQRLETPSTAEIPATPSSSEARAASIRRDCRILLAEDGPDNQRLIGLVLKTAGAEVALVDNGQLAVEAAMTASNAGRPFDVILMDMQMPVMDGYDATRQLRQRGHTGPIVALTAHASAEARQGCIDAGCDDFAAKPIDRQKLLATVARWTNRTSRDSSAVRNNVPATDSIAKEKTMQSLLADNPVIARLLPKFLDSLDSRVQAMHAALAAGRLEELRRLAHQLKGAGGSYGYPSMSEAAKKLEIAVRDGLMEAAASSLADVAAVCSAAANGLEDPPDHMLALAPTLQ